MTQQKPDPASLTLNEAATLRSFFQDNEDPAAEIDAHELVNTATAGIGQPLASVRGYLGSLVRKGYLTRREYTEEDRSTYALTRAGFVWGQDRGLAPADEKAPAYEQRPPAPGPAVLEEIPEDRQQWDDLARKAHEGPALSLEFLQIREDHEAVSDRLFEYARKLSAAGLEVPQDLVKAILSSRDTTKALDSLAQKSR